MIGRRGLGMITIVIIVLAAVGAFVVYGSIKKQLSEEDADVSLGPRFGSAQKDHFECSSGQCVLVSGPGPDQCSTDADCLLIGPDLVISVI
jgi:hypothetical protein